MVLDLVARSDVLIEGLRPGVTERLGLGPEPCLARNPALVYGRVTGWGQDGPLAQAAGHDIDYIALAGALAHMGRAGQAPTPPINMVGDFGGGGMLLVVGVLAALHHARADGGGQVVDAAMVDGAALQMTMIHDFASRGMWTDERGTNLLDTGAPFYDTYETSDGLYMAVGALEPRFFAALLERLEIDAEEVGPQMDPNGWPAMRARFAATFAARTRQEWEQAFAGSDACVAPVLTMSEATEHPHNVARRTFVEVDGRTQPAPAPRFSATPPEPADGIPRRGEHTHTILRELDRDDGTIGNLIERRIFED